MSTAKTEVTLTATAMRSTATGYIGLPHEELFDLVENMSDHLMEDTAAIGPVVFGQAGTGEIEIVFGIRPHLGSADAWPEHERVVSRLADNMEFAPYHMLMRPGQEGVVLKAKGIRLADITEDALV